ncbi:dynamin family protein [Oceanobacillus sojae]|uniref:dynamin family protein n=1 Tax=Oceanobacillus sojae TaxID=582851 RepID=UPI0021A4C4FF|nr:dynamin family protein [Oceanobacillus sojae]MCT1905526.1 dynamin family protein [Oceanobacillus sojae]
MITHMEKRVTEQQIASLYQEMKNRGDKINAGKMLDILEKYFNQEFIITLTGHFSAGKSSLINQLLGQEILANSPIPTSANIVKISSGEGTVEVFFHNGEVIEYHEPYDLEQIKKFSKNKEQIKKMHISTGEDILPSHTAILDTPGIDAADDIDRMLTEASLHLSDYLIYVTDYNHVQSEVNLLFLQAMQGNGLPFMIVINQIDKHSEAELPFVEFDKKIKQTFDQWNLHPSSIFYTSLKNPEAPHNEWSELKDTVFQMLRSKDDYMTMDASIRQIVKDHKAKVHREMSNQKTFLDEAGEVSLTERIDTLTEEIENLQEQPGNIAAGFLNEVDQTAKNAYLMPADLRELAKAYLESVQPDFKVGGLFTSSKKTKEAKIERKQAFMNALEKNVETTLKWKLRDKWYEQIEMNQLDSSYQEKGVSFLEWSLREELLESNLRKGATINGDYILNYTNDIAASLKTHFKKQMRQLAKEVRTELEEKNKNQLKEWTQQLQELQAAEADQQANHALESEEAAYFKRLDEQQENPDELPEVITEMKEELQARIVIPRQGTEAMEMLEEEIYAEAVEEVQEETGNETPAAKDEHVVRDIDNVLQAIRLPGFESYRQDLKKRKISLTERSYTIALFGAFSAGKSSFANAILGEHVLPVSPNPTTAAVNRIRPVTNENRHRDVIVTFKSEEMLVDDIKTLAKECEPPNASLDELITWLKTKNVLTDSRLPKMYQAYLNAMLDGYEEAQSVIGSAQKITYDNFESYVTDEEKACYIASMDLFYDCEVTKQGITLVDTPGADSINARHTNVSFEYIKHADAILYVTYYNHALSRADKDFLMQLGRVKDVFELDKMFFIVNAADLASDQQELDLVSGYVKEQLAQLGIRFPRLYPVSSKLSLAEKLEQKTLNEQMRTFESRFYDFIHHDLTALAKRAAISDIERSGEALEQFIQSLKLDQSAKTKRKEVLQNAYQQIVQTAENLDLVSTENRWHQKLEKQAFFLNQRFAIRFHDLFKEIYNPTTITESGRAGREQMAKQFEQLVLYMETELHQELLAVSLRVEQLLKGLLKTNQLEMIEKAKRFDPVFSISEWDISGFNTPDLTIKLSIQKQSELQKLFGKFKDTKTFFVQNQKEEIKEQLYEIIASDVQDFVEEGAKLIQSSYQEQWDEGIQQEKSVLVQEADVLYQQFIDRLFVEVDMDDLADRNEQMDLILDRYREEGNEA